MNGAEVLPAIALLVLILTGSKNLATLSSARQANARAARDGRIVEIEGCGHMASMEQARFNDAGIARFADISLKPAAPILVA